MPIRLAFFLIILLNCLLSSGQLIDSFDDGDFTENPVWSGESEKFQITGGQLNTGSTGTDEIYLSTSSLLLNYTVWEFYVKVDGTAPSGSNRVRVYLTSDIANIEGASDGYYIQIGQTGDDFVSLYRSDAGVGILLANGLVAFDAEVRIQVIRDDIGNWSISSDHSGNTDYSDAFSVLDNTHTNTSFFGWVVNHTSSRVDDFFLDDLSIKQLTIEQIDVTSNQAITVTFNQTPPLEDATNVGNYSISGINLLSAQQDPVKNTKVNLTIDPNTPLQRQDYTLEISSVLTKNDADSKSFSFLPLALESIITPDDKTITLSFNDLLDEAIVESVANFNVDKGVGQPSSSIMSVDEKKVDLTFSNTFIEEVEYTLSIDNIANKSGNSSLKATSKFNYIVPLLLEELELKSNQSFLLKFNKVLDNVSAESVTNYDLDGGYGNPSSAVLQSNNREVLLTFETPFVDQSYEITLTNVADENSQVINASANSKSFSYLNLSIASVTQQSETTLSVTFNQDLDQASAEATDNYAVAGIDNIDLASLDGLDSKKVTLSINGLRNSTYTLEVNNVMNAAKNAEAEALKTTFDFDIASNFRDIVINEVMADFTVPTGNEPTDYSGEYVEIYNPGSTIIRLDGFFLNNKQLPEYDLGSKEYVLIVDNSSTSSYSSFTNLIVISNFDALSTPRDSVILRDQFKNLVDSIYYDDEWYDDDFRSAGGYALEQINPELACSEDNNWTATTDNSGGTPAVKNTVFSTVADETAPILQELTVFGFDSIYLKFNEPIEESSLSNSDLSIAGVNPESVSYKTYTEVYLIFGEQFVSERYYTLRLENISDCSGNFINATSADFYFDKKAPVLSSIRVLDFNLIALIFDEPIKESTAERESNFLVDNLIEPKSAIRQDSALHRVHLTFESPFNIGDYSLQLNNIEDTLGNQLSKSESFSIADQLDTINVISTRIIELDFSVEVEKVSARNINNYILEGNKKPIEVLFDQDDSSKVVLAFADDFKENDELTLYVEKLRDQVGALLITPARTFVYDTRAPSVESVEAMSDSTLIISFDEALDTLVASSAINFILNDVAFPTQISFPLTNQILLEFDSNFDTERALKLSVKNIADLFGNVFTSTRNRTFIYDPLAPRVLSALPVSQNGIQISFNEKLVYNAARMLANYTIDGEVPTKLNVEGPDSVNYNLTFASLPKAAEVYVLMASLTDQFENIGSNYSIQVNTLNPALERINFLSDSSIALSFSQDMDGLKDQLKYVVSETKIDSVLEVEPDSVILFTETPLIHGDSLTFNLQSIKSASALDLQNPEVKTVFKSFIDQIRFLDSRTLELSTSTSFKSISKLDFRLDGKPPSLATLSGEDNDKLVLYFDKAVEENQSLIFQLFSLKDLYGRRIPTQKMTVVHDTQSPVIFSAKADFFNVITLTFSEKLDDISALSLPNYSLLNLGKPTSVELVNASTMNMLFDFNLTEGAEYSVRVKNVADVAGNYLLDDTIAFNYVLPILPERGDVLISEIMADPTPTTGLPEAEYIEIYNVSDKTFDLSVLQLSDPSLTVRLPERIMLPGDYVALVSTNNATKFSSDQVLGIPQFPSLGNLGDSLQLTTITSLPVDEVNYSSAWYADNQKDDGGYSLEFINPSPSCPTFLNWAASNSATGGTPGTQNSIYSLNPDTIPPKVSEFQLIEDTLVLSFNEYMDSLSVVEIGAVGFEIGTISFDQTENEATIIFSQKVARDATYNLVLTRAKDCSGNEMEPFNITLGDGYIPVFGEVIITEIMADPAPSIGLPEVEYLELYNASDKSFDLDVLIISDPSKDVTLPSKEVAPGEYLALVPSSSITLFEGLNAIGLPSTLSLGNTLDSLVLSNKYEEIIDEVFYTKEWYRNTDKDDGGYSLELINPMSPCPGQANWIASAHEVGGTPGAENSVFSLALDTDPPVVVDQQLLSDNNLRLVFNEDLDTSTVQIINFAGISIDNILINTPNASTMDLLFKEDLEVGLRYEMVVSGITDCSGNLMEVTTIYFGKGRSPKFNEVLITEMMADPDPSINLPSSEFFELQNMTTDLLSLEQVELIVGDDSVSLSSIVLAPSEIVVLCPNNAVASFNEFGSTYGVTGWISISNSADYIALIIGNQLVFDMNYSAAWYEQEVDGGISLEMKDTSNPCATTSNWSASNNSRGGTPGQPNSNTISFPDNFGPELIKLDFSSQNTFQAVFNERLSPFSLENLSMEITPSILLNSLAYPTLERDALTGEMTAIFDPNQTYTIRLRNLEDCNGNLSTVESSFIYPSENISAGLIINEILFNPKEDGVDYVEVYNSTEEYINLKDWKLGRIQEDEISQSATISLANLVLAPKSYLALTTNATIVASQYPQSKVATMHDMSSMPTYPNTEGIVVLITDKDQIMDQFEYEEDYHSSLLEDEDGVALERISFNSPTNNQNNWTSASSLVDFGTPGYENSQVLSGESILGRLTVNPKVFVPGLNGSVALQSFTTINYVLTNSGMFANVNIYNQNGMFIKSLASGASLSTNGFMQWDGTNESNNVVRMGYYIVVFELYDGSGNKETLRETVVVGR